MLKGTVVFLLLMTFAAISSATEDSVEIVSIDKNLPLQKKNRVAAPVVTEKYEYYEIKGNCEKDLHCQLCQNGCTLSDGKKSDSAIRWHMKWDYGYGRAPQACTADSFRAIVEIKFRYPKWVRTNDAPRELVEKWDDYMKNLIKHENGHRDLVVEAAEELSRAVAELPPSSTCADLDREVRALCRASMEKLNADQKEYDASTNHGVTQGVVFP